MKFTILLLFVGLCAAGELATVYYMPETDMYNVLPIYDPEEGTAYGSYGMNDGWHLLKLTATRNSPDHIRTFALGYLEGYLTVQEIQNYYDNINALTTGAFGWANDTKPKVLEFLLEHYEWANMEVAKNPTDPYWMHMGLLFRQLNGIMEGYNNNTNRPLPLAEFLFIVSFPDTLDVAASVAPGTIPQWLNMTAPQAIETVLQRSRCSGFIKPLSNGDLLTGHSTWIFFSMLTKIYKVITLPLDTIELAAETISFSSYPGTISSTDDWYQMSSGLVVLETSNSIFNNTLYNYLTPQSWLSWQRATIANRMSYSAPEWVSTFSDYNSGTYNNQWMVVDYNEWQEGSEENVLWVVEQIPGTVAAADVTDVLFSQGYWASYNIPYFESIYNMSGYPAMYEKFGNEWSYESCPRANIFRRNETNVVNVKSMQNLMRYNNWQNDPLSGGSGAGGICCRGDLGNGNTSPFGCTDSKVTSMEGVFGGEVWAIYGPTWDQQAPFSWSNWQNWPHFGLPNSYNFTWTKIDL
eukprot:TRINITY_DN1042_c0_g1_i1.p1 TRINITY_DN1042_c0_g1~~TRINITY_DN1042_c0_g1_i1.p1  ORF type:complete len:522 (+),score=135.38 TRINITY_DN1042_c0_g1_i1:111-1676(+)